MRIPENTPNSSNYKLQIELRKWSNQMGINAGVAVKTKNQELCAFFYFLIFRQPLMKDNVMRKMRVKNVKNRYTGSPHSATLLLLSLGGLLLRGRK